MKLKEFNKIKDNILSKEVKVTLYDGKEYIGKYVGTHDVQLAWIGDTPIYVKDIKEINTYTDNKIYKYVLVEYNDLYTNKEYSYKTTWKNIHEGDEVLVDCNGEHENAEVTRIKYCRRSDAPWPPENTKPIIKVFSEFDDYNYVDEDGILVEETYDYNETRFCPHCDYSKLIKIEYGAPGLETLDKADRGEVYIGGCVVSNFDPYYYCKECHRKYFEDLSEEDEINDLADGVRAKLKLFRINERDIDSMEALFEFCPYKKEALTNVIDYLCDDDTSKDINDIYVKIYRETHKKVIKHLITDDYEYFKDTNEGILIRLNLESGKYEMFSAEVRDGKITPMWYTPEQYDPAVYDKVANYDFNELKPIEFQEDVDKYIKDFIDGVKEDVDKMKAEDLQEESDRYDDYHEHFEPKGLTDKKGKKHRVYIYQDYESVDGYNVSEDHFGYIETLNRNYYEYYIDAYNKSLHKRDLDTNKYYEYVVHQKNGELIEDWLEIDDWPTRDLRLIKDFQKVLDYHNKYINEINLGIDNVYVDIDEMTKED